jgi:hypothetical protein
MRRRPDRALAVEWGRVRPEDRQTRRRGAGADVPSVSRTGMRAAARRPARVGAMPTAIRAATSHQKRPLPTRLEKGRSRQVVHTVLYSTSPFTQHTRAGAEAPRLSGSHAVGEVRDRLTDAPGEGGVEGLGGAALRSPVGRAGIPAARAKGPPPDAPWQFAPASTGGGGRGQLGDAPEVRQ